MTQHKMLAEWLADSSLAGANQSYLEQAYEDYLTDPNSVDESWRQIFEQYPKEQLAPEQYHSRARRYFRQLAKDVHRYSTNASDPETDAKLVRVLQLINAFRVLGHRNAKLDPIDLRPKPPVPDLSLDFHGFTHADLNRSFNVSSIAFGQETIRLSELYALLKQTYCGSIGAEFTHLANTDERAWIQQRLESARGRYPFSDAEKIQFLKELTAAEGLERYIGVKFPGAKRFSLEGGDALIPMLKCLIRDASKKGAQEVVLGMAHRGRLNVLVNIMGKNAQDLFDEFSGKHKELLGTGDVKYHQGFSSTVKTEYGVTRLNLSFNPSHLEIVSPVVAGSVRARLERLSGKDSQICLPITLHGDAALIGQGVVQETLNMSQVRAYEVGGTVRIVINNQIGFTTSFPKDCRSTEYCTDIAKMVQAPIFHVNADDPEAVAFVSQLALDFRNTFKRDVFIDLVCYRRLGHNEADEPSATQPMMYRKIKRQSTARKVYADKLIQEGLITQDKVTEFINVYRDKLDHGKRVIGDWEEIANPPSLWESTCGNVDWETAYPNAVDIRRLRALQQCISYVPDDVTMHPRVAKIYHDRALMATGDMLFDWGAAETLAYATLIDSGFPVRISGEDACRGTFFHRHAIVHNQKDGSGYIPLMHIRDNQAKLMVWDSVLSEEAVLAFEYGYATTESKGLTIWEAQFGDFANGAQVVIDQFISSGEQKWGQMCGLVMLLPHGYEGQGPEHSSARLERFLQLCAQQNIQVCVPSTPAQVYHMLRRQVLRGMRRPLVVMSPKSLLRNPQAVSTLEELATGKFENVIDEIELADKSRIKRIVLCSGKVYYELRSQRLENQQDDVALIRIEQLYPFPSQQLRHLLAQYPQVKDFVWCQEEPQNQGAWYCSQHHFREVLPQDATLRYAGRPASASPAVGYMSIHNQQQQDLINDALTFQS